MAFVGRERELTRLAAALQRAADGETSRVVLAGPAGIGISRLLDELVGRLSDVPGVIVARGRAFEPCAGIPYASLADALASPLASLAPEQLPRVVGSAARDLARISPSVAASLAAAGVDPTEPRLDAPDQRGARVAEGVLGVLERLASDGVVLLTLEDIHWADPATRGLVGALVRVGRRIPLCLVVTYQSDEIHRRHPARDLVRQLSSSPDVMSIEPPPLDREELYQLVGALEGTKPSGSFMAAVLEGSGGFPLHATQLVAARASLAGVRLSDPFDEIVHARLARTTRGAQRTIQVLAAARRPLGREELYAVELPDGHLSKAGLHEALESGLAVETGDRVGLVHELYTEAIEGVSLPPDRHDAHVALARLLEGSPAEEAWHWERAGRSGPARAAHIAAAAQTVAVDPGDTTLFHLQRALELGDRETDRRAVASETSRLLADAAGAAAAAGAFRRAAALARQAIDHRANRRVVAAAAARGDPAARALQFEVGSLYETLGRYRWAAGDAVGGMRAFEDALDLIPVGPDRTRARALASLAQHLMIDGRFEESASVAEQARETAAATGDAALAELGHATCTLGVDVSYLGDLERGLGLLHEATDIARRAGRLDDVMRAHANRTTLLDLDSRREEALAVVTDGLRDANEGGLGGTYGAFLRGNAADILFTLGRWRESEVECRAGMEWRPSGVAWFSPTLYLGLVLVESRADDEAARLVGQTLLELESVPAGQWTALVQRAAVSLALWRGETSDALTVAEREWDRVLQTDDELQIAMAASTTLEACAAAGEAGRQRRDWGTVANAGQLGARVLPEAERRLAASTLPPSLGARREAALHIETARAHLRRVRGRTDAQTWARLAEAWTAVPVPFLAAKARWWQASAALQARDQRAEARTALHAAWEIAASLPAEPLARAVADLAGRARIPLPGRESAAAEPDGPVAIPIRPSTLVAVGPGTPSGETSDASGGTGRAADAAASIEEWSVDDVIALASTATGRAIGQRLLAADAPRVGGRFGLSPRENEVLGVLAEGRTNREIAERLFISERTVGVHVRKILSKLGVSGRVEAAGLAIRLGLVGEDPVIGDYVGGRRRG